MPTAVVTGGAGFLGSHLCEYLLGKGLPRALRRQPRDQLAGEPRAPARRRVRLRQPRHGRAPRGRRAGGRRLPPRGAGEPDRLPAPAAALAQGRLVRDAPRARPREVQARALPALLDERGLRRPAGAPAARELLGQRQPDRPARRLRRGEALRRGADDGVPQPAGRGHRDRPDLQHLRAAHALARRARDPDLHAPGARERADHRLRRGGADAELLLRGRPDPRPAPARRERASTCRSTSATRTSFRFSSSRKQLFESHRQRARSSTRHCPWTIRRFASPTSPEPGRCSGWEPEIELEEGLRRMLPSLGREPLGV